MDKKFLIDVYTDGACSGNPGVGGWGVVITLGDYFKEFSGAEADTTNNRMELIAVIMGLSAIKEPCEVNLYSDSAYVVNAFEQDWVTSWESNNWKNANNKDVKNRDLWLKLLELLKVHDVHFIKVKGHADNELNNRCDTLATTAIKTYIAEHPELSKQNKQENLINKSKNTNNISKEQFDKLVNDVEG